MHTTGVPTDTDPAAQRALVAAWRTMSIAERVALVDRLHADVESMAIAGIRAANGELSDRDLRYELARRRYGRALADEVYASTDLDH